jgi:NitT/TauT family transport system substrate-binding protein
MIACLAAPSLAKDPVSVSVGVTNTASDVSMFIAHKRGYFKDEGLSVELVRFDSAGRMIAPFASGELDVGAGAPSAALYNAVGRGIDIRIVSDKNSTPPGRGTQPLLVRKDLVESGRFKTLKDLKGMKVASAAPGTAAATSLSKALEKGGIGPGEIDNVYLGFPQHVIALTNKAIDASFTVEPSASEAVRLGSAVRIMGDDEVYPNHQLAVILFSGQFIKRKPEAAKGFLKAYLRGVRDFNDGLVDGKYAGPKGEALVDILVEYGPFKDRALYKYTTSYSDPNGTLNLQSLEEDLNFFRRAGLIEGTTSVQRAVDTTLLEAALKEIGRK